ncbi:phospholipase [Rhizobium alvei]|uniref:Phospholipase n=1 Tax=Rhizobium alvei TaxID=1132659 RepID=A0ABT8YQ47_9HYPH|nr:phospholipase [Rhizobium alvei]MDO6965839.1 phospholipase [Rhizobium alvei]
MSTVRWPRAIVALPILLVFGAVASATAELKPYKDELFAYPAILETRDGGNFLKVDYQELRDINERDEVPERRVRGRYVSLKPKSAQENETLSADGRRLDVMRVGNVENAAFAVIFLHGRGGDRRLGANDYSFGGNFNRLKNLAMQNAGVYFAPSVRTFDAEGAADIAMLIRHIRANAPGARIVLSCASMGSFVCWSIARDKDVAGQLAGMMIMGGVTDPDFRKTAAYAARLPMFFSHGSSDSVYPAADQIALYESLSKEKYPTRFVLFETGSHGTPIRMTDWRDSLNWLFEAR